MYDEIYKSLFEITSFFNRPKQDKALLQNAGISIDPALFPLIMRINYYGSLGIVALAEQVDRDYSTVSRQVDKLISFELVIPVDQHKDRRKRTIGLTAKGKAVVHTIALRRRIMMSEALQSWDKQQLDELQANLKHLVKTIRNYQS